MRSWGTTMFGAVAAFALFAVSCASPDPLEPTPSRGATERFAVVTLSYTEDARSRVRDQLQSRAYFVEHPAEVEREQILNLLNVAPGIGASAPADLDTCTVASRDLLAELRLPEDRDGELVRLLDAGELLVDTARRSLMLDSFYFPDAYSAVAGLSYEGVAQNTGAFDGGWLTINADGSDEVGAFSVRLRPPSQVAIQSIAGQQPRQGAVWLGSGAADLGLPLSWAPATHPRAGDRTVVAWIRRGFDEVATIVCEVDDDGAFTVPEAALAALPLFGADQTDRLVLQRLSTSNFSAEGLSDGTAVAISRDDVLIF